MKNFISKTIITISLTLASTLSNAESIAVIANTEMTETLDENAISRIFLGKTNNFPSGAPALAVDLGEGNPARAKFQEVVLKKSDAQLKSYWAKQIFTAQGTPPKSTDNIDKLILLVSKNPSVITYVPVDKVPDNVRVVAKF
ncbi:phosphate ABC transporter substrate-binding protein [Catenovulum sp. SM1970]|uniref:phosphate ABC transporter substrate-binding protein n=1 Tax=Marinifaba aquimaris TaxID=2741323 RepID=UPI0015728710|nr:phosphate ABC transporter substrate-binding protein [Marinifaba aquimaris]NTS78338.1 phosphate ABC transporter substrate-binding protein [Marinifaba aquimaris]